MATAGAFPEGSREFTKALGPGVGYGVVIGVGLAFALIMIVLSRLQAKFTNMNPASAQEFAKAGSSVKPGLVCCGIVSAWTWAATLLQSSTASYQNGVSGGYWYAVGGTVQICFMAAIAAKVKVNANGAVTFLEIVKARYGRPCHLLFTFYAFVCWHIVTASLVLGASDSIAALTGANVIACCFLLPAGIAIYVIAGGLRATFIIDWMHTVILFVILYLFIFTFYGQGSAGMIGSPGGLWDLLQTAAELSPVDGNAQGSYTTLKSNGGLLFAANSFASGTAGVFCDQGYWQRAIASRPDTTTRAYMFGGLSWFAVPWAFGSVMGLSARALQTNPAFPTYPYELSSSQVSAGLAAPAAAVTVMGKGGAVAVLLVVFMAATSATSAELIAVSSIVTRDVIGLWRPLSGHRMVHAAHITIAVFAVWAGVFSVLLHKGGVDLGWLYYIQGVALTPAVVPIAMTVLTRRQSKWSALIGTLCGTACSMTAWFVSSHFIAGEITVASLALPSVALSGAGVGLVVSSLVSCAIMFIKPDNYDWSGTRALELSDSDAPTEDVKSASTSRRASEVDATDEKKDADGVKADTVAVADDDAEKADMTQSGTIDPVVMHKIFVRATWMSALFTLAVVFVIPFPLFFTGYVYSREFFTGWTAVNIAWLLLAGFLCVLLPVIESRRQIWLLASSTARWMTGCSQK